MMTIYFYNKANMNEEKDFDDVKSIEADKKQQRNTVREFIMSSALM